ncbi:MAG: hypothetical protein MO852_07080, partial [Candidatus Devosia euplotis]|nr:hypothetical protein [Candidatus Devosia euplotis]
MQGSFYLRGSAAGNALGAKKAAAYDCAPCGSAVIARFPFVKAGYGYSVGAGVGYETGTGLRADATVDYFGNEGLKVTKSAAYGARAGDYKVKLRSTIAPANVYYDFAFGGDYGYGAEGGAFGYVGAGTGVAFNHSEVSSSAGVGVPSGDNASFAAAGMVGRKLVTALASAGHVGGCPISALTLADVAEPSVLGLSIPHTLIAADLSAEGAAAGLIADRPDSIFH